MIGVLRVRLQACRLQRDTLTILESSYMPKDRPYALVRLHRCRADRRHQRNDRIWSFWVPVPALPRAPTAIDGHQTAGYVRLDRNFSRLTGDFDNARVLWEGRNFEDVYSSICRLPEFTDLTSKTESRVAEYFASLELPNPATIYDYLVLCLRPKDVIATFNWDPFPFGELCL